MGMRPASPRVQRLALRRGSLSIAVVMALMVACSPGPQNYLATVEVAEDGGHPDTLSLDSNVGAPTHYEQHWIRINPRTGNERNTGVAVMSVSHFQDFRTGRNALLPLRRNVVLDSLGVTVLCISDQILGRPGTTCP